MTVASHGEPLMNDDILKGNWKQLKGSFREAFGELTDDDVEKAQGNKEQLVGKIQERYGESREQAAERLNSFLDSVNKAVD